MWNEPTKEELSRIPKLYETEEIPLKDKIVHLHLFLGGSDWYIIEYDGNDLFWGFAILNGDYEMSEFGYISFSELKSIKLNGVFEIDRDLYWKPRKARYVDKICKGNGWPFRSTDRERNPAYVLADRCKVCGSVIRTSPEEKNLFCKKCGATTVRESYYIGRRLHRQKPTA